MAFTLRELQKLARQATQALDRVVSVKELESWRVKYLGRKGTVPQLLRHIKDLPQIKRRQVGEQANELRRELEERYRQKHRKLGGRTQSKVVLTESPRYKLPMIPVGHLHPLTLTIRRIQDIMSAMGFLIVEGPEVEEEYYDFDALNVPLEHPARSEADSFFVSPRRPRGQGLVLRSSTSAVQVRTVIERGLVPPFMITSPGRVFRNEKVDATHESTFHQVEALMVGTRVTIADYKGVTETLFSTFFGRQAQIRLRPGFFPFVEPGFEVDMTCPFCKDGCRVCKYTRWLEMGGAGMVHPNVLKNMNIDPKKFQGFAFGYGIDRFAMLWHGIDDIRLFWSGDIRFLRQFA